MKSIKAFLKPHVEKFPALATSYRKVRDGWQIGRAPQPTPNGFKLVGNLRMQAGTFEPLETKFFKELAADVDVVINAGANIGYYCCHALAMNKHVVAFEPINLNLRYLLKNLKANGWENNVRFFRSHLQRKPGLPQFTEEEPELRLSPDGPDFPDQATLIPTSSLDLVLGRRFDGRKACILIDIEGAEYELLQGAEILLSSTPKPVWIIEIDVGQSRPNHERIQISWPPSNYFGTMVMRHMHSARR